MVVLETGILYRKHLANNITVLSTDECRLTAFILKSAIGPVLFVNDYMPQLITVTLIVMIIIAIFVPKLARCTLILMLPY